MSSGRYTSRAHQRDRQSLFDTNSASPSASPGPTQGAVNDTTLSSPYGTTTGGHSVTTATLASLEEQSDATLDSMKYKLGALHGLSVAMGEEISRSKRTLQGFSDDMASTSEKMKWNMNRMRTFVEKTGVGWKVWCTFATLLLWAWIWVWLC